jgi:hypothetical protein
MTGTMALHDSDVEAAIGVNSVEVKVQLTKPADTPD